MNNVMDVFAERLKGLRTENKLSLMKLALAIGVSDNAISRWENKLRIPNIEMLNLIAKYFNVTPNYLLGYEN